jgi:hypothetical protein
LEARRFIHVWSGRAQCSKIKIEIEDEDEDDDEDDWESIAGTSIRRHAGICCPEVG